jgi:hypothetical protein
MILQVKNVNHAFKEFWWKIKAEGMREESRNGPVLVMPGLFVTEYARPTERVLFNPARDANPVFHLMEAIWMLAGENNVKWLSQFSSNISNYAESDGRIMGAYGARWRKLCDNGDQIFKIIDILNKDSNSRQAVIQMWDCDIDLDSHWKDRPCNTHIYFDCRGRKLNMTVCCRSNDALWGAYGANAVHMSVLQEVIAYGVGMPVGVYRQVSNNMHVYTDNPQVGMFLTSAPHRAYDKYREGVVSHPLLAVGEQVEDLLGDCHDLIRGHWFMHTAFMRDVAQPLMCAYIGRKSGLPWDLSLITDCDWKVAFTEWCERREQ